MKRFYVRRAPYIGVTRWEVMDRQFTTLFEGRFDPERQEFSSRK